MSNDAYLRLVKAVPSVRDSDPACGEPHSYDVEESGVWTYRTSDVVSDGASDDRLLLGDGQHPWWIVRAWRWLLGKIRS